MECKSDESLRKKTFTKTAKILATSHKFFITVLNSKSHLKTFQAYFIKFQMDYIWRASSRHVTVKSYFISLIDYHPVLEAYLDNRALEDVWTVFLIFAITIVLL